MTRQKANVYKFLKFAVSFLKVKGSIKYINTEIMDDFLALKALGVLGDWMYLPLLEEMQRRIEFLEKQLNRIRLEIDSELSSIRFSDLSDDELTLPTF